MGIAFGAVAARPRRAIIIVRIFLMVYRAMKIAGLMSVMDAAGLQTQRQDQCQKSEEENRGI